MKRQRLNSLVFTIGFAILFSLINQVTNASEPVSESSSEESVLKSEIEYQVPVPNPLKIYDESIPLSPELQDHALTMCKKYGIDSAIFFSLMYHESRYEVDAFNGSDYGLCQINRVNWKWLEEDYDLDIKNEYDNIEAGVLMLSIYLEKANGDYAHALTGYNTGSVKYVNEYARRVLNL